uniref:Sugar phosphate phosphatase n=1 Tax=Strongyloides papillosus TaxID=174720 RepID=A0A0N5B6J4_STREA
MAEPLIGSVQGTFAFATVHDRWPKILTKIIDQLHRRYAKIRSSRGEKAAEELTRVINRIAEMRYHIMTNKPLNEFNTSCSDSLYWNGYISKLRESGRDNWYDGDWLFVECYMYRMIYEFFSQTTLLKDIDHFEFEKVDAYKSSEKCMIEIASKLDNFDMKQLLLISLWANKYDLSLSGGDPVSAAKNFLETAFSNEKYTLVDDSLRVFYYLKETMPLDRIDIITDNFCLEFFADLCFGEKFLNNYTAKSIKFHIKPFPWFVSDVTSKDANYLFDSMINSDDVTLRNLGLKWRERLQDGTFIIESHPFWSTGASFYEMNDLAPKLYEDIKSNAGLVIFKGDLNYRKLVGDRNWDPTNDLLKSIFSFDIFPFLALRTMKSETVAGLSKETYEQVKDVESWMVSGDYALIQFGPPK